MKDFRLVILDYPKLLLNNDSAKHIFSDVISSKQLSYERASETYVSMNSLDMVSTHILLYDVSELYKPKLVTAIRNCYEARAHLHHLKLPSEDYIKTAPEEFQRKYFEFRTRKGPLVDCNAWFVDPEYTWANTKTPLSEIAWFGICLFTMRRGFDHWMGATNERFKASRWAAKTGTFEDGMIFKHPVVPDPHKLIMIEKLNEEWLKECFLKYQHYLDKIYELSPTPDQTGETLKSIEEIRISLFAKKARHLKVA